VEDLLPTSPAPVIVDLDYRASDSIGMVDARIESEELRDISGAELTDQDRRLLESYPTVYMIRAIGREARTTRSGYALPPEWLVYVGETNSIDRRTFEHHGDESIYQTSRNKRHWRQINARDARARMLVIGQGHFNKSLTLDLESTLMSYVLASGSDDRVVVVNSRDNPQGDYYTKDELAGIVSQVWEKLHRYSPRLFPAEEEIRDSAIFKASPFHRLGDEQLAAEATILGAVDAAMASGAGADERTLIVVEGAAGTGKSVLLSHLFFSLFNRCQETGEREGAAREVELVVNHDEQLNVYNSIMRRLGIQRRYGEVVKGPVPFINEHSEKGHGSTVANQGFPASPADIVLVDEAHLLLTQGNQSYHGMRNMLLDIMRRARMTIAVYDPEQVQRHSQEIGPEMMDALFPEGRIEPGSTVGPMRDFGDGLPWHVQNVVLRRQFRIDACDEVVSWIDDFASGRGIGPIPKDAPRDGHVPYRIEVASSPWELLSRIEDHSLMFDEDGSIVEDTARGISRVLATYDWKYSSKSHDAGMWEVRICREETGWVALDNSKDPESLGVDPKGSDYFSMPWNYELCGKNGQGVSWAERPETIRECGSIYTIQGFDLNYAGVILGPSVGWRDGKVVFDVSKSHNYQAVQGSDAPEANIRHELNVLLKRGVHGLVLFAVDPQLQRHLEAMASLGKAAS
jgi:DUF2075 family protein